MEKSTRKKILCVTVAAVFLLGGVLGFTLRKPKSSSPTNPLGYVTDGLNLNGSKDLIDYAANELYNAVTPIDGRTETEIKTDDMFYASEDIKDDQEMLEFGNQIKILGKEYTRNYESERAQNGLRRWCGILFDFVYTDYEIRGKLFKDFYPSTQEQIKDIAIDIRYMLDYGYSKDDKETREFVDDLENNARLIIKEWKHGN